MPLVPVSQMRTRAYDKTSNDQRHEKQLPDNLVDTQRLSGLLSQGGRIVDRETGFVYESR